MHANAVGRCRLTNQQISRPSAAPVEAIVAQLGAVQAQEYQSALWALGLRSTAATAAHVEQALAERRIVRTWPMRGTIHLVAPADVRWMLEALAARELQRIKGRQRQLGLDAATLQASERVITRALEGGQQRTRPALRETLEQAGIKAEGARGLHILRYLAHVQVICFGVHEGKQPTFALLDEWIPPAPALPREEALAGLALRYALSHGPVSTADFQWWTGLPAKEAHAALAAVAGQLETVTIDQQTCYLAADSSPAEVPESTAYLLPAFDEFLVAYRNRTAVLDPAYNPRVVPGGNGVFNPIVVIDGRVLGTWKRTLKRNRVLITVSAFESVHPAQRAALEPAVERYGAFLGLPAILDSVTTA